MKILFFISHLRQKGLEFRVKKSVFLTRYQWFLSSIDDKVKYVAWQDPLLPDLVLSARQHHQWVKATGIKEQR